MGLLSFRIRLLPDLTLNKYQSLADTGPDGVLARHSSFLRQWHGICLTSQASFHLLYVFCPSENIGNRLNLFFMIQGESEDIEDVKPLLLHSPLSEFFLFEEENLPEVCFKAGATLIKKEVLAEIYNPIADSTRKVHYVPAWEINEGTRLYDLFRILETIGTAYHTQIPCAYRIDLYPVNVGKEVRDCLSPVVKDLKGDNEIQLVKADDGTRQDDYAQTVCKEQENWIEKVESSPCFRVNLYGFADNLFQAKVILNSAGAEALSGGDFLIAPIKPDHDSQYSCISRMGNKADTYCFFPNNAALPSWSTMYSLSEAEPFFRFPVLYEGEHIEIPKETDPKLFVDGLFIGKDENDYDVYFSLKDLPRHAFFTGTPGSGKTNTMLHIVTELKKKGIPFLVMEPAKKEYRELLGYELMKDVRLFSPHLQSYFPLAMNPFEFPEGVRLSEHINALLEVFQGSFVLEGPTYRFLSDSIQKAYFDLGWDIEDINGDVKYPYPTLQDVYDNLETAINRSSYDSELKGNVRAFLQVRLGSLMERDAGELFDTPISTIKPEEWLSNSAIIELEVLNEQAKNFLVLLVCHYILETLRVDPQGGHDQLSGERLPVRHAMFIEEAHNIIAPESQQSNSDTVDPKVSATAYIVKMLAEVRALREAIVIADQLPTALAVEVTKNTGLKLVHRLTSQDDREQVGTTISATPVQLEQMASFSKGMAFIYHERVMKPFKVQVAEWIKPKLNYNFSEDPILYRNIINREGIIDSIEAAIENWREKYLFRLDNRVQELQEQLKNLPQDTTQLQIFLGRCKLVSATAQKALQKCERLEKLWCRESNGNVIQGTESIKNTFDDIEEYLHILKRTVDDLYSLVNQET